MKKALMKHEEKESLALVRALVETPPAAKPLLRCVQGGQSGGTKNSVTARLV